MACKRNRIIDLINYTEGFGIKVKVAKNKAQGNRGFFKAKNNDLRIDIAKGLDDNATFRTLVHEFIHYVHYSYDKTLKSLDFIFDNYKDDYMEDLISLTVDLIPKNSVKPFFDRQEECKSKVNYYLKILQKIYPDIRKNVQYKKIENKIGFGDLKYLLKYDRVKVLKGFKNYIYSVENLENDFPDIDDDIKNYLYLKSAERNLKRINSKISRLNRYYNSPTELLARSFEYYISEPEKMEIKSPKLYEFYKKICKNNKIPMITELAKISE